VRAVHVVSVELSPDRPFEAQDEDLFRELP